MLIHELFTKDLFRPINGVVKVDQQDEAVVWQELDEYVVTRELSEHLRRFFSAYLETIDNSNDANICNRMGVWVSGFFGSGKSHFIKILSYLLRNKQAHNIKSNDAKQASDFFDDKIKDPLFLQEIKRAISKPTDVILFNIDTKADNKESRDVILQVFVRVFNKLQGFSEDAPYIAEMENYLLEKNLLSKFHQAFKDTTQGEEWLNSRDTYRFMGDEITNALAITLDKSKEESKEWFREWFDKGETDYSLNIEKFAKQVKKYLDRKGKDHRIVFIVDEVGQFIGSDTHLMLNLQTITEELGRICGGRAWVIVTSQEDIDKVLGEVKSSKAHDFSKIQGRFHTRLSLSSTNTDEVIQIRLLEKTDIAQSLLEGLFEQKGEILKHQISFKDSSGLLKSYKNKEDFVNNYPFAPYHFPLVQKIFESIRKAGATGLHLSRGERSMLDAFQVAVIKLAKNKENIGVLVPLYEFYPSIQSFLDTSVKRTIDQAGDNPNLESFDLQLLQVLFLIRYVKEIKSNIDNLVTLCINQIDADRLSLKRTIEESLHRLERETLINSNGDLYFFLTNEERDVNREIKTVDINNSEQTRFLAELIYQDVLKGQNKHRYQENKKDYGFNCLCDGYVYGSSNQSLVMEFITPLFDDFQLFIPPKCIGYSAESGGRLLIKLEDSIELARELRAWLQTEKYIRLKHDAAAPETLKYILENCAKDNQIRRERLAKILEQMILEADFYALGEANIIKPNPSSVHAAINEAQSYLIKNTFTKLNYIDCFTNDIQREITATLMVDTTTQHKLELNLGENNSQALKEIKEFIDLNDLKNQSVILSDLVNRFTGYPYGWPEGEIALLIARLLIASEISLMINGEVINHKKDAITPLTKSNQWKLIKILKHKAVEVADLKAAAKLGQHIFGKLEIESEEVLYNFFIKELNQCKSTLLEFKPLADRGKYPGKKDIDSGLEILNALDIQDRYQFFEVLKKKKNDLEELYENLHDLKNFHKNQYGTWEKLQNEIQGSFKDNRQELDMNSSAKSALEKMEQILKSPNPYGMLKDVENLIATVTNINDQLVKDSRESAIRQVDVKIEQLQEQLASIKADVHLSNQVLFSPQNLKKLIQAETSIPSISHKLGKLEKIFDDSIEIIDQHVRKTTQTTMFNKQVTTININTLSLKPYIDTPEEAKHFIHKLQQEIDKALQNNTRVKIK